MLNSVNQIRVELEEIANAHLQINNFFWGDFLRAYKENTELNYVLMGCFYPTASLLNNQTQLTITIYIADRVYKDYSNLNDVESDTLQICRDVYNVINSSFRWKRLGRVQSASAQKFIERGGDEVAGHTLTIQFLLRDVSGICELPMQGYDFDQPAPVPGECDPAELQILDSNGSELYNLTLLSGTQSTQTIQDSTAVLKDTEGNTLSTTSILAEGSEDIVAPDAVVNFQYEDGTPIETVNYLSGSTQDLPLSNAYAENSDSSYTASEPYGTTIQLPDITVTDSNGSTYTQPSVTDVFCTPCEGVDVYVGEANVGTFPSGSDVFVKVIQDGLEVIPEDITVVDDEVSIILADVPPCPDTNIEVNGVSEGSVVAGSTVDVQLVNTTPNVVTPLSVTSVGTDRVIELDDVSYDIYVNGVFNTTVSLPYGENNTLNITN